MAGLVVLASKQNLSKYLLRHGTRRPLPRRSAGAPRARPSRTARDPRPPRRGGDGDGDGVRGGGRRQRVGRVVPPSRARPLRARRGGRGRPGSRAALALARGRLLVRDGLGDRSGRRGRGDAPELAARRERRALDARARASASPGSRRSGGSASHLANKTLVLTAAEAEELVERLEEVLQPYLRSGRSEAPEDARHVRLLLRLFPREQRP